MTRFDVRYRLWTAAYPEGFVPNVRLVADPEYALHRASCESISSDKRSPEAFTDRGYEKICAASAAELQLAAKREGGNDGSFSKRCGLCRP